MGSIRQWTTRTLVTLREMGCGAGRTRIGIDEIVRAVLAMSMAVDEFGRIGNLIVITASCSIRMYMLENYILAEGWL